MKKCAMLVAVAGLAATSFAQVEDTAVFEGANLTGVMVGDGGYASRATPVYSNGRFPGINLSFLGGVYDVLDEVDFTGGVWDGVTGRAITEMNFGLGQFAAGATADIRYQFYSAADLDGAGAFGTAYTNPDMLGTATPFFTQTIQLGASGTGIYSWFTQGVNIPVPDGVNKIYVRFSVLNSGTTDIWTGLGNAWLPGFANDLTVGGGLTNFAMNTFNIGTAPFFTGNPNPGRGDGCANPTGETQEHRNWALPPACRTIAATNGKGMYLVLGGEISLPDPSGTIDLGTLPDGCTTRQITLAAGETKYYKITLAGDANDNSLQFLDIDTEGSAGDAAVAVWAAGAGSLEGSDSDDGSGTNGQLTYGIGRRPGVGDGNCYDGRDGELLATTSYIIGVSSGAASFGPSYAAVGAGDGGAVTLNICTNTAGTAAAASIAPCQVTELGDIAALAGNPPEADMDPGWVVWYKFSNCSSITDDADANVQGTFLDFDFSTSFPGSDTQAMVFDAAGNLVAEDNDSGTGAFSQFSFGDVAPERSALGNGLPFAGQDGALAAGDYYMAVGLFGLTQGGLNRFHVRSNSGSSLPAEFVVYSNGLSTCSTCPPCAADFNQDGGVDGGDIESFFSSWEGGDACGDVNQDGGVDGGDIESFFGLWEAGGC